MSKEGQAGKINPVILWAGIVAGTFLVSWAGISFFLSIFTDSPGPEVFHPGSGKVGVVELKGLIVSPEKTIEELTSFRKDKAIKAIVLRIDSPGGAVGASQEIFSEVRRTDRMKPVIASFGSIAASGGYYAALGARKIVSSRGTLTGSIGVIVKFANLTEIFDKLGYRSEVIKSGKLKDIGAANRQMTDEEKKVLQDIIDNVHEQFVGDVGKSRNLPLEKVRKLADGRIFSGEQALESGLVDQFGNFTDAVRLAAELGGIKQDSPPLVYPAEKNFSLLKLLVGDNTSSVINNLHILQPVLSYEWSIAH
ncbi:MAG: signal peptide peptidase SppA [Proteobacteria bacterium]|nr:signal peptide peptidase SppA [Pseudomonadota bacterium]MBU1737536.1 signal peptide peptidase SppA [Pseudomonadota bacterium]